MKITEIDLTETNKKYQTSDNKVWVPDQESMYDLTSINDYGECAFLEETYTIAELLKLDFKEYQEPKYYLVLDKPYIEKGFGYLNYNATSEEIVLGTNCDVYSYQTQFTADEVDELIQKFGDCINDFKQSLVIE